MSNLKHVKPRPKDANGHVEGSRKGKVHALWLKQGQEAAWVLGAKLKLKPATLRSWFYTWGKATPSKASKKAAKKAKPAKTKAAEVGTTAA